MSEPSADATRVLDVTLPEVRRIMLTVALLIITVLYLFLGMLASVLLDAVHGIVIGIYLSPVAAWTGIGSALTRSACSRQSTHGPAEARWRAGRDADLLIHQATFCDL